MLHIKNAKVEKRKADYYTIPELKAFFAQDMDPAYRHAFMGLLLTGMRFAEMANLKWDNVNMGSRIIRIQSNAEFITKTRNSERLIPIGDDLFRLLLITQSNRTDNEFVFCSPKGNKLRERSLLGKCKAIAVKAKISAVATLHKFRHTYATLLIHRGVPIQNIKELLGHASIVQTEVYAHNKADHLHSEVGLLDNLLET
jgi:site-specific recombinase XerD